MAKPCSALDPAATMVVEDLMRRLARGYTIAVVAHRMQQASRVCHWTGLFWLGELVEYAATERLLVRPQNRPTEEYLPGRRG